ncbi:DNA primase [Arsenicicoccus piscis]|uniref:DNA primase n=2 Tax=Arsenicicoccus piscis TaxID=673954 RepID=UPI001F4D2DBB|nr:DNA primase [Arsenicicoccus piscis]
MAGRIKAEDVALVKERASIEDVVRQHVTLRNAGPGSLKGLCPFHDEKTPSFTVRPAVGSYHCFGCGEGGDVIDFVRKVDHLDFTEAVERLAVSSGVELHYEEGGGPRQGEAPGRRARLVEAHRAAAEFYGDALITLGEARQGRDFLRGKGFDGAAAKRFGVGYAPRGGEDLTRHLRGKGFSDDELVLGGLSARGRRGLYDRFRGRVVWPIRDVTGDTVGFGARRIFPDDRIEAKYLNTSETPIYKKTTVLYGLDLAKKAMARDRQAVIVEGYTDVMACHLAGIEHAVATCGTSFGLDHIKVLRRILRDEADQAPAKVIFTFDGDAAGQKAAMRAFAEDQRWASQSFVAVADAGQDPNELRQSGGDEAVQHLVADAVPMFEFAVRTTMGRFDLATAEGRVGAIRAVAPIIAGIRDQGLRPEYSRTVAGWLGVGVEQVTAEVARAGRAGRDQREHVLAHRPEADDRDRGVDGGVDAGAAGGVDAASAFTLAQPDLRHPAIRRERQLLVSLLQYPGSHDPELVAELDAEMFSPGAHRHVFEAMLAAGGWEAARAQSAKAWVAAVAEQAGEVAQGLVAELSVAELPERPDPMTGQPTRRYLDSLDLGVHEAALQRRIDDAISALQRSDGSDPEAARQIAVRLTELQRRLSALKTRMA